MSSEERSLTLCYLLCQRRKDWQQLLLLHWPQFKHKENWFQTDKLPDKQAAILQPGLIKSKKELARSAPWYVCSNGVSNIGFLPASLTWFRMAHPPVMQVVKRSPQDTDLMVTPDWPSRKREMNWGCICSTTPGRLASPEPTEGACKNKMGWAKRVRIELTM